MWPLAGVLAGESMGSPTGRDAIKDASLRRQLTKPTGRNKWKYQVGAGKPAIHTSWLQFSHLLKGGCKESYNSYTTIVRKEHQKYKQTCLPVPST